MDLNDSLYNLILSGATVAFNKNAFVAPQIPERKLNGSIMGVAKDSVKPHDVILIWDTTVFGGAGDGMLLTLDQLFYKELGEESICIDLAKIKSVTLGFNAKKKKAILFADEHNQTLLELDNDDTFGLNAEGFCQWFSQIINLVQSKTNALPQYSSAPSNSTEEQIESAPLEQLPIVVRMTYLKVVLNSLLFNNQLITPKELSCFYSLISRLNLSIEERFELFDSQKEFYNRLSQVKLIRKDLKENPIFIQQSIDWLNDLFKKLPVRVRKDLLVSLLKDLIYIYQEANNKDSYTNSIFILEIAKAFSIEQSVLDYLVKVIENDLKIFDDNVDDKGLNESFSNIAAGAATVGVPIAALYFSGSVIGLGAAGITSGLATLGLGGFLGLSSMVTGIGALVLIGIGANKGVKMFTGQDDIEKRKQKEAMLLNLVQSLQRTLQVIIEDINNLALKLNTNPNSNSDLLSIFALISSAGKQISNKCNYVATKAARQRLPLYLNIERLKDLTKEPTYRPAYDAVINFYCFTKNKDEEQYVLKDDLTLEETENLVKIFQRLGYFDVTSVAMAGLKSITNIFN